MLSFYSILKHFFFAEATPSDLVGKLSSASPDVLFCFLGERLNLQIGH